MDVEELKLASCKSCGQSMITHAVEDRGVYFVRFCDASMRKKAPDIYDEHADESGACRTCGESLATHFEWQEPSITFLGAKPSPDKPQIIKDRSSSPGSVRIMLPVDFTPCDPE